MGVDEERPGDAVIEIALAGTVVMFAVAVVVGVIVWVFS